MPRLNKRAVRVEQQTLTSYGTARHNGLDDEAKPHKRKHSEISSGHSTPPSLEDTVSEISKSGSVPSPAALTIHLTVHIPVGHTGPITLQLCPDAVQTSVEARPHISPSVNAAVSTWRAPQPRRGTPSITDCGSDRTGFLDLPPEIRNAVYRLVFVTPGPIDFSSPTNFARSAAFLRTCHLVHREGSGILYSENVFHMERRTQRHGSIWSAHWQELGFRGVQRFTRMIGPNNLSHLTAVTLSLEDAVLCLNPRSMTSDERRFVHDSHLLSALRRLAAHASSLRYLELYFGGRRRLTLNDDRFLKAVKRLKADSVEFIRSPSNYRASKHDVAVARDVLHACTRRKSSGRKRRT